MVYSIVIYDTQLEYMSNIAGQNTFTINNSFTCRIWSVFSLFLDSTEYRIIMGTVLWLLSFSMVINCACSTSIPLQQTTILDKDVMTSRCRAHCSNEVW